MLFLSVLIALSSCSDKIGSDNQYRDLQRISYKESTDVLCNPERGLYRSVNIVSSAASPISENVIKMVRTQKMSTFYFGFYLGEFMDGDISQGYLNILSKSLDNMRKGGVKCILRFAYKNNSAESQHPFDPEPEIVLRHIQQLKPILQEYSDIIVLLQAGFVGVWGEWAFTDHFVHNPKTDEDYKYRKQVVDALLDIMPEDRQIALRTPNFKMDMYHFELKDTLTESSAHDGSIKSRLCGHNDCFGATYNDMGTFRDEIGRDYWKAETRYYFMCGETCKVSDYCTCDVSHKDLHDYHWTLLNANYNKGVLDVWKNGGCYNKIVRELGYCLVLRHAYFSPNPAAGKPYRVVLQLDNVGTAAPMNPRAVELVLVSESGQKLIFPLENVDPRFWFDGQTHFIDTEINLPEQPGTYDLYLNLPDPEPKLKDRPEYSIQLSNKGLWNSEHGYNKVFKLKI